jgi:hypothetical protein
MRFVVWLHQNADQLAYRMVSPKWFFLWCAQNAERKVGRSVSSEQKTSDLPSSERETSDLASGSIG